jgi:hypothetical protein
LKLTADVSAGNSGRASRRVSGLLSISSASIYFFTYHFPSTLPWLDYLPDFLSPWRADAKRKHLQELEVGVYWPKYQVLQC